jgi:hypothetical protein
VPIFTGSTASGATPNISFDESNQLKYVSKMIKIIFAFTPHIKKYNNKK